MLSLGAVLLILALVFFLIGHPLVALILLVVGLLLLAPTLGGRYYPRP